MQCVRVVGLVFFLCVTGGGASAQRALTPAQEHLAMLRGARASGAERVAAIEALVEADPAALAGWCQGQWSRRRDAYVRGLGAAASGLVRAGLPDDASRVIGGHRAAVLGLVGEGNLTKAMIQADADPALAALRGLLVVELDVVYEAEPELAEDRAVLEAIAAAWPAAYAGSDARDRLRRSLDEPASAEVLSGQIADGERVAVMLATPMPPADQRVLVGNLAVVAANDFSAADVEAMDAFNQLRVLLGLRACAIDPGLVRASVNHSTDMEELGFFAHESPVDGRTTPWDRARQEGTNAGGENIAAGQSPVRAVLNGWWHSPGHFKNMLGAGFRRVGIGSHGRHATQLLGR